MKATDKDDNQYASSPRASLKIQALKNSNTPNMISYIAKSEMIGGKSIACDAISNG